MAMRRLLFTTAIVLAGGHACLAQVSDIGTTAMGLPTTPAVIVTSPLNGPGPFSATTLPGTPGTTLAPVPLASDPTTPGTVIVCAMPTGQLVSGTPAVQIAAMPALGGISGTTSSSSTVPAALSGLIVPSFPAMGSATGTLPPPSPLGSPSTTVCSSTPGGPPTNGAALPLSTPAIPATPPPGTIQPDTAPLAGTSIDPTSTVVPTPNTSACAESLTMNLATPGMMMPANATGAAATPGVSSVMPSGC
jgi:hypothetical protein